MAASETPDVERVATPSEEAFRQDVPVERELTSSHYIPPLQLRSGDTLAERFESSSWWAAAAWPRCPSRRS
jgi:hypothetical protein